MTVSRALRLIAEGALDEARLEDLAERLGVGPRHLRRLFAEHLGASPVAVARTRRVHFARRLIDETCVGMSEIALSSGFRSIRHFNHSVRATFGSTPTDLRHRARSRRRLSENGELCLRLPYRPPYDWHGLLAFLEPRTIPGVEYIAEGRYRRIIEVNGAHGFLEASAEVSRCHVVLRLQLPRTEGLMSTVQRGRRLFDLDADPLQIETDLRHDPALAVRLEARPGVRVPGVWDPFETAVCAVLAGPGTGKAARRLMSRLVQGLGKPVECPDTAALTHLFPSPDRVAEADLEAIGIAAPRADAVRRLARVVADGTLSLDGGMKSSETVDQLRRATGVCSGVAQYIALRALGEPDAFPEEDVSLRRILSADATPISRHALRERAARWRPWRAYAAMCLWQASADDAASPWARPYESSALC